MTLQPPTLPESVATFDCIDHGAYCPRGYNPSAISGRISGIPIAYFTSGEWLKVSDFGSGSTFIFRDANGKELGRAHKPSAAIASQFPALRFVPAR